MADKRLTSTRVAEILGVTASSIKRWADDGLLVCELTAGGHRRFLASEVARFRRQESENTVAHLASLTDVELDALPYGVVGIDDEGVVTRYNATEANFTHLKADQVIGQNFFTQIAKCTNNSLVMGQFFKGISAGNLDVKIHYTFTYVMRPTNVIMHLIRCQETRSNWILVHHKTDSSGTIDDSE
jgi:photoactive yellow protein